MQQPEIEGLEEGEPTEIQGREEITTGSGQGPRDQETEGQTEATVQAHPRGSRRNLGSPGLQVPNLW